MKKIVIASASAIALLGLAACGDTDDMTTQGVEETAPADPATDPVVEEPAVDEETTQSIEGGDAEELETEEPAQQ